MRKFDLQDLALRVLIVLAGSIAALIFILKGQGTALPALAIGGSAGAWAMSRFGPAGDR